MLFFRHVVARDPILTLHLRCSTDYPAARVQYVQCADGGGLVREEQTKCS